MPRTFVSVLLPLALPWEPVYSTSDPSVRRGERVVVPIGTRLETGVVTAVGVPPGVDLTKVKPVVSIDRSLEMVSEAELAFWEKVASYYLCCKGEVLKAAYPASREEDEAREVLRREKLLERLRRREEALEKARKDSTRERYSAEIEAIKEELGESSAALPEPVMPVLSPVQQEAAEGIHAGWARGLPVLLEGVTGSGKTEIYCSFAAAEVAAGRDVLYLVPEIGLTRQLEERLRAVFGARLLTFHSHETPYRRRQVASLVRSGGGRVVLGTRSAVFLPFASLSLVVVDEEQESSYKQDSPAPRYNGRDAAMLLAGIHGAHVLLGSATPSLESVYNVSIGRYAGVKLLQRYYSSPEPDVEVIDTSAEMKKGGMVGSFSRKLIEAIVSTRQEGGQVLILRARRGYSPSVQCSECGIILKCPRCSVPLSYHSSGRLICHYCGHSEPFTGLCPDCGAQLRLIGAGTQKVEDELREIFPTETVARLDSDAVSEKEIIKDFSSGKTGILVGTQMVSKGFDFGNLRLAAVLHADGLFSRPDFRSDEKAFQTLSQLKGRIGRRDAPSRFLIQASQPEHPVIQALTTVISTEHSERRNLGHSGLDPVRHSGLDPESLHHKMLAERRAAGYPPYTREVCLWLRDRDAARLSASAAALYKDLSVLAAPSRGGAQAFTLFPPLAPPVGMVAGEHRLCIRIFLPKDSRLGASKRAILDAVRRFSRICPTRVNIDVDPV